MPSRFVVLRAFIDTTGLPREQRLWLPVLIDALFEVRVSGGGTLACEGLWPAAHPLMNDTGVGTAAPVRWRCQTPIHRPGEAVLSLEQVVRQLDVDTVAHNAALGFALLTLARLEFAASVDAAPTTLRESLRLLVDAHGADHAITQQALQIARLTGVVDEAPSV